MPTVKTKPDTLDFFKWKQENKSLTHRSAEKVDVLIPAVEKDLCVLGKTIEGVRQNLKHPLNAIIIVAPPSGDFLSFCEKYKVNLVDEKSLNIPRPVYSWDGRDRSGWLLQQFIKLSGDRICSTEYFYIIDADTVLIRPQAFELNGQTILLHSDEHYCSHFNLVHELIGPYQTELSFVAHQMLFKKEYLKEMKDELEDKFDMDWIKACLAHVRFDDKSGFADYELYGHWLLKHHPDMVYREYYYNMGFRRSALEKFDIIKAKSKPYFKSLSFHSYEDPQWQ